MPDPGLEYAPGDGTMTEESIGEAPVEDIPVLEAIEETPAEATSIPDAPVEATIEGETRAPTNPLPISDEPAVSGEPTPAQGASPSGTPAQPASSSKDRIKEALRVKRPYAKPTLDKVPNPPVPDTTKVQLRELPVEFDSYGYIRSQKTGAPSPSPSYYRRPSSRSAVVWSATGELIK